MTQYGAFVFAGDKEKIQKLVQMAWTFINDRYEKLTSLCKVCFTHQMFVCLKFVPALDKQSFKLGIKHLFAGLVL